MIGVFAEPDGPWSLRGHAGGDRVVRSGDSRWTPKLPLILLALFLLVAVNCAWICDDAYIGFRVADNFAHGYGLTWNVAERVQVYTCPLWIPRSLTCEFRHSRGLLYLDTALPCRVHRGRRSARPAALHIFCERQPRHPCRRVLESLHGLHDVRPRKLSGLPAGRWVLRVLVWRCVHLSTILTRIDASSEPGR